MPLTFLGQIYLEEVPRYRDFPNLPASGILYFFWDTLLYPQGFRASSKGSCQVFYINNTSELQTSHFPLEIHEKFRNEIDAQLNSNRCSILFEPTLCFREKVWLLRNYNTSDHDHAQTSTSEAFLDRD
ncbi:MAG: DUF1963 domain-containing protein [Aphanocapsa sp. GSE-SYN-MK-11-07L]|nr:DUF1963 domain-containing protein [Aphanocapsa sp. GSE-SYN-MK-11-07L]